MYVLSILERWKEQPRFSVIVYYFMTTIYVKSVMNWSILGLSRDVTKIQPKKLSIILSLYFHDVFLV